MDFGKSGVLMIMKKFTELIIIEALVERTRACRRECDRRYVSARLK